MTYPCDFEVKNNSKINSGMNIVCKTNDNIISKFL